MASVQISKEQMLKRVARFSALQPSRQAFADNRIPGHERVIFNVIGRGVTEDASLQPAIIDVQGFNLTFVRVAPGKGAALHSHPTVEVFTPLCGEWSIYWGERGEEEIILGPWDTISVPPGVMRGFRNVGQEEAYLMAILGGTDAGRVSWAPQVLEQARQTGLQLDAQGNLSRQELEWQSSSPVEGKENENKVNRAVCSA